MNVERIRRAIEQSELSQAEIARRVSAKLGQQIDRSIINKIAKNRRDVSANEAVALEYVLAMHDEPRRVSLDEEWQEEQAERDEAEARPVFGKDQTYRGILKGSIPEIDVSAGAGEGKLGEIVTLAIGTETYSGHAVVEEWVFPEPYVSHELNAKKGTVFVMPVVGDSMEPTYRPGDRILVDTGQTTIVDDTVFVISDGYDGPKIKRLSPIFGSSPRMIQIVSDNQNVPMQTYPLADFTIIGRVVGVVSRR